MYRVNKMSKSTKRRRVKDETQFLGHLSEDLLGNNYNIFENNQPLSFINENSNIEITQHNPTKNQSNRKNYNLFEQINSNNNFLNVNSVESASDSQSISSSNSLEYNSEFQQNLVTGKLVKWAIDHNVPNNTFSDLLKILKMLKGLIYLPSDARTLYQTNSNISYNVPVQVKTIAPGIYYHFGLSNGIKKYLDKHFSDETIKIVVGVDGLPLSKSSGSCFWPILGYIRQYNQIVFPIGIYWGHEKPYDSNIFMKDFIDEVQNLSLNGISVELLNKNNKKIIINKKVVIDAFCCDSPAKAYLLKIKGHTGFYSCTRCMVQGKYLLRRVCIPDVNCIKRTHEDFINHIHEEYHLSENITNIINIPGINITQHFTLDYMHLVCLGVVKKILTLWKGSKDIGRLNVNSQKFPINVIKQISTNLLLIKNSIPCDFSRKPRGLDDLARWKATEFRQFLLYTGISVLRSIIPKPIYDHFLCLSVAMTIFLSPNLDHLSILAKSLMISFVKEFGSLYGTHFISHNIHGLIHLIDDYNTFGCLDQISCFKFENYMGQLKKMVRKHDKPLQQVVNRFNERDIINIAFDNSTKKNEPIFSMMHKELMNDTNSPQYRVLVLNKLKIKIHSDADTYVGINVNGQLNIVKIVNICYSKHLNKEVIIGRQFNLLENMFEKPIESSKLGIYKISNYSKSLKSWEINNINTKYFVSIIDQNCTVAIPIIHFEN